MSIITFTKNFYEYLCIANPKYVAMSEYLKFNEKTHQVKIFSTMNIFFEELIDKDWINELIKHKLEYENKKQIDRIKKHLDKKNDEKFKITELNTKKKINYLNKDKVKKQYDKLKQKIMMMEKLEQLESMTKQIEV